MVCVVGHSRRFWRWDGISGYMKDDTPFVYYAMLFVLLILFEIMCIGCLGCIYS